MQTRFTEAQLADPAIEEADRILRACVHCGFCTATCPTYLLQGDELDGPRGRIYLIKDMLEGGGPPSDAVVEHLDRCLGCMSCMTTCPSGVDYRHLSDLARGRIEQTVRRPAAERVLRGVLAALLPRPGLFRLALIAGAVARPALRLLPGRLGAMAGLVPASPPSPSALDRPGVFPAEGKRRKRVALLAGCVQRVLAPEINDATIRLLTRHGVEVVVAPGAGCCGALAHHMGRHAEAQQAAAANIRAWDGELKAGRLDAVVANASGCGAMLKDYGHLFAHDRELAEAADRVAAAARDISEILSDLELKPTGAAGGRRVAYHSACALHHGQRITEAPKALLRRAGFTVAEVPEAHICCGSAGTYNLLQPELAEQLRDRKAAAIDSVGATLVAAGNIGCMTQLKGAVAAPILHTVELLDWATGGPRPEGVAESPAD